MASSRLPGPLGLFPLLDMITGPARSTLGRGPRTRGLDSPGSLGHNDWAAHVAVLTQDHHPTTVSTGTCACNRDLTLDELCKTLSLRDRKLGEKFLPYLNDTFKAYDIQTCLRKAHFLAQVGHESARLRATSEYLSKGKKEADVYDGYKGRGLIQLTYARNYKAYGKAAKHNFLDSHRTDLEKPKWASDSAGWFWTSGSGTDLNALADKNDLLAISARINGAFNGFDDRRNILASAFVHLGVKGCKKANVGDIAFRKFRQSECFGSLLQSFAWGAWNDEKSGKHGITKKSVEERKAGYARYIELNRAAVQNGNKDTKKHYGYTPQEMESMAAKGVE